MKANTENVECMKEILASYCAASGQKVSVEKSSVFFSPNTRVEMKEQICSSLNIMTEALSDTYLGLPSTVGLDRTYYFQFLVDRVMKRIMGW